MLNSIVPVGQALVEDFAQAWEDQDGTSSNWFLTVYGICANPLPGIQRVDAVTVFDSNSKSVTVTCPAGQRVVGTGFVIVQGNAQAVVTEITPSAGLTSVRVAAVEDQDGFSGVWSLRAIALCANA